MNLGRLASSEIKLDTKEMKPDGMTTISCPISKWDAVVRIVKMKNEIGEGGSDQSRKPSVVLC